MDEESVPIILIALLLLVVFWGGIAWVAIHFIIKFW